MCGNYDLPCPDANGTLYVALQKTAYDDIRNLQPCANLMNRQLQTLLLILIATSGAIVTLAPEPCQAAIHPDAFAGTIPGQQDVEVPDTPAGKRFAELIEICTEGDADQVKELSHDAFTSQDEETVKRRAAQLGQIKHRIGEGKLLRIEKSTDHELVITLGVSGGEATFSITVEAEAPHRISNLAIAARPSGEDPAAATTPLTAKDRESIIEESAQQLEQKYVFPEVAEKMAAHLRESLKSGKYDELSDPMEFARTVTDELREICHDRHLSMRPAAPPADGSRRLMQQLPNRGFVKAEILPGNIGYIKFNMFDPSEEAQRVAAAAMEFVREADALIFDVRDNGGGSPVMIVCLSSYLFAEPTHLNNFYNRATDSTSETWTTADKPENKFRADLPVYVLTSNYTFSAAEEFTYNLQCLKRATIVGEVSGGGAHPVRGEFVGGKMQLRVPFARAINPITNTNWEGVGIKPDVECSASDALDKAVEHAKQTIKEDG